MSRNYTVLKSRPVSLLQLTTSLQLKPTKIELEWGRVCSNNGYSYVRVYKNNTYTTFDNIDDAYLCKEPERMSKVYVTRG